MKSPRFRAEKVCFSFLLNSATMFPAMRMIKTAAVICVALIATAALADKTVERCFNGVGAIERKVSGYTVRVGPAAGEDNEQMCRAVLESPDGQEAFTASDFGMEINAITGASVTNDGVRSLVLEGYSGGAHCCWTYWIVSLGSSPGLVKEIQNQTGVAFDREKDGRIVLSTGDGAFDYFDDLPHVASPIPLVLLAFEGHTLKDVGAQFLPDYDERIDSARKQLSAERIEAFRSGSAPTQKTGDEAMQWMETKSLVLSIVLDYLYSGREQQAWNTLDEMWPAADRDRIAKLIVETRESGILSQTKR
jgi:hypothetical protein